MYFDTFSEEKLIAFKAILREFDLDNRRQDIATLFALSVGRIYWKEWTRLDAIDPDFVEDGEGIFHQVDGWPRQGGSQTDIWRRKWKRRAELFSSWNYEKINHILDWLIAATTEPAAWIANVDELGRPKKLMKCGSLERLTHEADKAMRKQNASIEQQAAQLGIDDEQFVYDLGAGHTLVRLLSPRALDIESARMHHCIGHGGYDHYLRDDIVKLYSIRDSEGQPVATIQTIVFAGGDYILQFLGPWNSQPPDHLQDLISSVNFGTRSEYLQARTREVEEQIRRIDARVGWIGGQND